MKKTAIFDVLSESISIRMLNCNEANHPGDWAENKMHTDYDLWLLISGVVEVKAGGVNLTARPGDWVFFYPGMPYSARTVTDHCRFIFVHFEFGIGEQSGILEDFPLVGVVPGEWMAEEARLFHRTFEGQRLEEGLTRLQLKGSLTLIVAKILQLHEQGRYTGAFAHPFPKRRRARHQNVLSHVLAYLHEHLHESVTIAELAALAGMSEKYFIPYFKRALGVTPGQYTYQLKMNKARDYLYDKREFQVQEIASLLGYADPYTFSKAFKKYYKVAPSQFK